MGEQLDPFASLFRTVNGQLGVFAQVQSFVSLVRGPGGEWFDTLYLDSYALSLRYAFLTTALCLMVGYPFAYFLARTRPRYRALLLLMVMLPFWTSFLLRVYAWKGILADQGVVNRLLMALGLIQEPVQLLYNDFSMLVGMTYVYLPFMVLPLYANLVKADIRLVEAAQDLGASAWKTFWLVTVPLSRSGVVAGSILVFIPCLGEFVIPSLLGGADNIMIGRVVWDEMFSSNNWPRASALSISMIVLVIAPLAWFNQLVARKSDAEQAQ
jgi:putrescine transport system permease protein